LLNPGRTLRTKVTAVAGFALTAVVVLGLAVMYVVQVHSAKRTIASQLRTYAAQVQETATVTPQSGGTALITFPRPLPGSPLDPSARAQVLDTDGHTVLASDSTLVGMPALFAVAPGSDQPVRQKAADAVVTGPAQIFAEHVVIGGRRLVIVTGTASDFETQIDESFARLVYIGAPVFLLLAFATVWLVVGRALRPVERIRLAVTEITAADLARRVPEPATDDEIAALARTMNDMLARLDAAAERQRRFVADASHELRSPLTAIRTGLQVGLAHPDKAPWPSIATRAGRQAERLEALVSQLLVLARSDSHRLAARRRDVDVADLLADVLAGTTIRDGVRIEVESAPGTRTQGDPDDLARAFRNIVDNAVRHARSTVRIGSTATADGVRVTVADDGPGVPVGDRERVFDRFVRLDASRAHANGSSGLGLAIAKEIVTAHGGTVAFADPGDVPGARVVVELP
jgi:signal transduction histidine kinase